MYFLESHFLEVRNSGLQPCNIKEKIVLHKGLFEIFEIENILSILRTSKKKYLPWSFYCGRL